MDKKITPPKRGNKNTSNNSTINLGEIEKLTVEYMLKHPDCNRWDLGAYIETGYAPDIIQHIRRKGIDIKTTIVPYTKRSGKKTHIGLYRIKANSINKAKKALGSNSE